MPSLLAPDICLQQLRLKLLPDLSRLPPDLSLLPLAF
jgi:hypothetical protein